MKAITVAQGIIANMDSQHIRTGYNRHFTLQWSDEHKGIHYENSIFITAYNEVARLVKSGNYKDGDTVQITGRLNSRVTLKHHETWLVLTDIRRV